MKYIKHLTLSIAILSVGSTYAAGDENDERNEQVRPIRRLRPNLQVIVPQHGQLGVHQVPRVPRVWQQPVVFFPAHFPVFQPEEPVYEGPGGAEEPAE